MGYGFNLFEKIWFYSKLTLVKAHEVQLVNYLVATGKPVGLILNFGETEVEIKRKVKDLK